MYVIFGSYDRINFYCAINALTNAHVAQSESKTSTNCDKETDARITRFSHKSSVQF